MMPPETKKVGCTDNSKRRLGEANEHARMLGAHVKVYTTGFTKVECGLTMDTITFDIYGDAACGGDKYLQGMKLVLSGCTKMDTDENPHAYENRICDDGAGRADRHMAAGCTDAASTADVP